MKHPGTRRRRVPPKQEAPIRNRLTTPTEANRPHTSEADPLPSGSRESAGDALRDALECGVRTAYTVINEYMRRGYEAARANQNYQYDRGDMRDETRGYTGWNNAWNPMATPMQQWAAMMRAWTEAWSAFMPGGWPQQMWGAAWPGFGAVAGAPAVSVQVCSRRRADVTTKVSLMPGAECLALAVGPLAAEGSKAQLQGVSISGAPGSVRIVVPVAAEQPAGAYCGEIKTGDGRPVGNLTVTITDLPGKSA